MQAKYTLARYFAAAWRFQTLRLAQSIFPSDGPLILKRPLFGADYYVDVSRTSAHQLSFLTGERMLEERHIVRRLVGEGQTAVDVGANIGYYLLMLEQFVGPRGRVVCFEPEPNNFEHLARNAAQFPNAEVRHAAVGDAVGVVRLEPGVNGILTEDGEISAPLVSIDSADLGEVHFMKIDVEGYERQVLQGAAETLRKYRPSMFIEIHPYYLKSGRAVAEVVNLLTKYYGRSITYYESAAGRLETLINRYVPSATFKPVRDLTLYLSGKNKERFWAACEHC